MPQTLSDFVAIRPRYARSVHLQRDGAAFSFATSGDDSTPRFYFTPSIREALDAFALGLDVPAERAVTLVGPYGAGKSAFAVFLANLLENPASPARELLRARDAELAARFEDRRRFLLVKIVGARAALAPALIDALSSALQNQAPDLWPQMQSQLADVNANAHQPRAVADAFGQATRLLCQNSWGGVAVIIDELGKFLEFAATHPRQSDVFALQELAEGAARSGDNPLLILGMLHRNPEAYAQRLSRAQQSEWSKVAQRFRQITLFPSDIERMDMVGRALQHTDKLHLNGAFETLILLCAPFAPAGLGARFETLARAAFPLHPLALLALPSLFARAGQSHRSLFNFLCGQERGALASFLREQPFDAQKLALFTLDRLFDYARETLQNGDAQSRGWQEAVESVERVAARDPAPLKLAVVKAIALLSWLRDERLPASREALHAAFDAPNLAATLRELETARLIVWSRARNRYRLWEGGDIDIEAEIARARGALAGDVTIRAATDENLCPLPQLSARRHGFQTGTIRPIPIITVRARDAATSAEKTDGELAVLLILAENEAQRDQARAVTAAWTAPNLLFGLALESETLREAAAQIAACAAVAQGAAGLEGDRAARRELGARRAEAQALFSSESARLFHPIVGHLPPATDGSPDTMWWHGGALVALDSPRHLSAFLSVMADATFWATPVLRNELLNRRALSSAGASARRALLTAMLERPDQERLGFTGFPPERSMYGCALQATQLHVAGENGWHFQAPPRDHPTRLWPAWNAMESLIFAHPPREVAVEELAETLRRPPFGVSQGTFPVVLAAFMTVHQNELTLYEGGAFKPEIRAADWEMLTRRPEKFAVAGCRVAGARRAVVQRLAASLNETAAVVPLVRRLLKMTRALPEFAWKTRALPPEVLALRAAIEGARSPEKFLFEQVPLALGSLPLGETEDETQVELFFAALNAALKTWSHVAPQSLARARDQLLRACELAPDESGWRQLQGEAARWNGQIVHPLLVPFFQRLAEPDDVAALEGTLALIAHRPPKTWSDADVSNFADLVAPIGEALRQIRRQHEFAPTTAPKRTDGQEANAPGQTPSQRTDLAPQDQEAARQLARRLSKSLVAKDGTPASPLVIRLALEELLNKL